MLRPAGASGDKNSTSKYWTKSHKWRAIDWSSDWLSQCSMQVWPPCRHPRRYKTIFTLLPVKMFVIRCTYYRKMISENPISLETIICVTLVVLINWIPTLLLQLYHLTVTIFTHTTTWSIRFFVIIIFCQL